MLSSEATLPPPFFVADLDPEDKDILYDGIHPATKGYQQLFDCLQPQVQAALEKDPCPTTGAAGTLATATAQASR